MDYKEQTYRLLFDSNPHPMWVYDRETLSFLAVNDAAVRTYGYTREEFLATTLKDIRPPEDISALLDNVARVRCGMNSALGRHQKKDGTLIDVEITSHTLAFKGRRAELVLAMDVTERKRAEKEHEELIREQAARTEAELGQQRFKLLADASALLASSLDYEATLRSVAQLSVPSLADHCVIDLTDENGEVHRVEVTCADAQKKESARQLRKYCPDLNNPNVPVTKATRSGKLIFYPEISDEFLVSAARNEEHLAILRTLNTRCLVVAPLIARSRTLGAITFALAESNRTYEPTDLRLIEEVAARAALAVDNARLYEETKKANLAKDEFLATVSHELRTPLTAMLAWSRMLEEGKLDKETSASALRTLANSVKTLSHLIDDLLDVSRIAAGKLRIDNRTIELVPVIQAAIYIATPAAKAKNISIKAQLDESVPPMFGDPDRLQEVIWNLLSNAIKFSPAGSHIKVELKGAMSNACIVVKDKGEGISAGFLPYVFDRFRQADSSDIRKHGGLGIGLAIARALVEMHGGTIGASSQGEGLGSTFTVTLPLMTGKEAQEIKLNRDSTKMASAQNV